MEPLEVFLTGAATALGVLALFAFTLTVLLAVRIKHASDIDDLGWPIGATITLAVCAAIVFRMIGG